MKMREIKFRAYDKDAKPWNEKYSVRVGGEHRELTEMYSWEHLQEYGIDIFIEPGSWEIMQYTGLKDKNGKEIYEGDVIKINCRTGRNGVYTDKNCQVVYNTASFVAEEIPYGGIRYELHGLCEVIGNIYQNPELLK